MSLLVLVAGLILILHPVCALGSNQEVEALSAMIKNLEDPNDALLNWDSTLALATTFWHLESNNNNSVTKMNLGRLSLSGQLAGSIGQLKSLEHMLLNDNNISGGIPSEFGNLKSLLDLDLHNNILNDSISDSLGELSKLVYIRLQDNKLSGRIPDSFTKLRNLLVLDLSNNKLSGQIPAGLFAKLPNLRYVNLSNNELSGTVPTDLTTNPGYTVDPRNNAKPTGACTKNICDVA